MNKELQAAVMVIYGILFGITIWFIGTLFFIGIGVYFKIWQ